jgi:diguanylate cyclase (GGDEF)-like protein/PAS domain S-box-containing protein
VTDNVSFALENFERERERRNDERRLRESEEKLRLSEAKLKLLVDAVPASIVYFDADERYTFCNRSFAELVGRPEKQIIGRTIAELFGEKLHQELQPRFREMTLGHTVTYERQQHRPDGSARDIAVTLVPHFSDDGNLVGAYGLALDITDRKALECRLEHMAQHDALTGLPNRALFEDRLAQTVARSKRSHKFFSVMYLDIDHFKSVNDSLGHGVGDDLLKAFANRLRACIRESDTAARLGGDEFAIVLNDLTKNDDAAFTAQKIVTAMRAPFELPGVTLSVTTSVGAVLGDGRDMDTSTLVAQADLALYQAKASGRNAYRLFEPDARTPLSQLMNPDQA